MSSASALLTQSLPQRIQTVPDNVMNHASSNSAPNVQNTTTTQRLIEKATLQAKLAIQLDQEGDILGAAQAYHLTCLTLRQALHLVSQQDYPALVQVYRAHSKRLLYLQGVIQKRKDSGSSPSSKSLQWGRSMSSTPNLRSTIEKEKQKQDVELFKGVNEQSTAKTPDSISEHYPEKEISPKAQPLNSPIKLKLRSKSSFSELPGALNPITTQASKKYTIANRNRSGSFVNPTTEPAQRPTHTLSKKHSSPALSSFSPVNTSHIPIINPKPITYQLSTSQSTTSTTSLPSFSNTANPLPSQTPPRTLRSKTASQLPKLVLHSSYNNLHSLYNQGQELYSPKTPLHQITDTTRLMFQSIWNEEMESKQPYHPPPSPTHPIYPLLILQRIQDTMTTGGYPLSRKFYLTPLTWSHPNLKFANLDAKADGLDSAIQHLAKFKETTQSSTPTQICKELDALELNLYNLCVDMSRKVPDINLTKLASTPTGTSSNNRKMSNSQSNNTAAQAFFKMASKITKSVEKVQNQFKFSEESPNKNYLEKLFKFLLQINYLIELFEIFGENNQVILKNLGKVVQLLHIGFLSFILSDCSRAICKFLSPGRPLSLD